MTEISNNPQSYMDFAGLGNLRGQASQKNGKATKETATQFEAMMIQMMLKSMRESIEKDDLMGNSEATKTFEEMYDKELSVAMAKKGSMGVADMLVKHINQAEVAAEQARERNNNPQPQQAIQLNPPQQSLPVNQSQPSIPLIRPEKFSVKPEGVGKVGELNK